MELFDVLLSTNPWWRGDKPEVPALTRDGFEGIDDSFNQAKQMICVQGLRRVGKTTLIMQLIRKLLDGGVKPESILYISLDDPRLLSVSYPILEAHDVWGKRFGEKKGFLLVDEAHFADRFDLQLKRIWDAHKLPTLFTGSVALFLKKGISDSLAGRVETITLPPLSFGEFLKFRNVKHVSFESFEDMREKSYMLSDMVYAALYDYISVGGFPEILDMELAEAMRYLRETYVERVLMKDIPAVFGRIDTMKLFTLFVLLAERSGSKVNFTELSSSTGLKIDTVMKYIEIMETSGIVRFVRRLSRSFGRSKRVMPKVYLPSASLLRSFKEISISEGALVENAVENHLPGEKHYWEGDAEVDFVAGGIPIEVKFSNRPEDALKGLRDLRKHLEFEQAVVVTRDRTGDETQKDFSVVYVPAAAFLLGKGILAGAKQPKTL